MTSITIDDKTFFKVGEKVVKDKKETNIKVEKIKVRFGKIKVYLSNREVLTYGGYKYISS